MVTVIKKGSSAETVREQYKRHTKEKKEGNIKKFCGVIELKKDPLRLQRKWRNEWE